MTPPASLARCVALLAAVAATACAGSPRGAAPVAPAAPFPASASAAPAAASPADEHDHGDAHGDAPAGAHGSANGAGQGAVHVDPAAVARARADSARKPYTAADVRFMSSMIGHHAQAVAMSRMAPSHGAGESVRTLADRIINAQLDDIALMQQWLRERSQPVPSADAAGSGHDMHHGAAGAAMPGMLTAEQMRQLDGARGEEFDRLFLSFMIQHHRGAVAMVRELFASYGAGQNDTVFKFASDVNVDQTTEIARMQRMLAALTFEERAP